MTNSKGSASVTFEFFRNTKPYTWNPCSTHIWEDGRSKKQYFVICKEVDSCSCVKGKKEHEFFNIAMFYLNTIEQLFLFVEQLDQLEVCLPNSRLLTGIPILWVYKNFRWNSNKTCIL